MSSAKSPTSLMEVYWFLIQLDHIELKVNDRYIFNEERFSFTVSVTNLHTHVFLILNTEAG